jgi:hypothetical protein
VDLAGFIILFGGFWALSLPFGLWLAYQKKRPLIALVWLLPTVWFVVGFWSKIIDL